MRLEQLSRDLALLATTPAAGCDVSIKYGSVTLPIKGLTLTDRGVEIDADEWAIPVQRGA